MRALTRQPGDLSRCELTFLAREPIDTARARLQHAAYQNLLRELGAEVISLPPEPDLPDSVFVEDAAVVLDECALLPYMGAASRRPETERLAAALAPYRPLFRLEPPGGLDGGDVLRIGRTLYIGVSRRTDRQGIASLERAVEGLGYEIHSLPVRGCLHLKSACTLVAERTVLLNPAWVDAAAFAGMQILKVPPEEPGGANVLRVGKILVASTAFPRTAELLLRHELEVRLLDNSELLKAEAGLTCMSLLFDDAPRTSGSRR